MSRIGKKPVVIPQGVKVQVENGLVRAEGPKGKLAQAIPPELSARVENNTVVIGYRAQMQGKIIQLALGYSHPVIFPLPDGITAEIDKQVSITLRGADKE